MKPMGTIPYFLAALRRRVRARSLAASSSKATWLKRAKALRTCDLSLIGRRFRPRESTYAKALLGNRARFFELSWPMAEIPFRRRATPGVSRRSGQRPDHDDDTLRAGIASTRWGAMSARRCLSHEAQPGQDRGGAISAGPLPLTPGSDGPDRMAAPCAVSRLKVRE